MVSNDGGRGWQQQQPPALFLDLAIDPSNADHVVASGEAGLLVSRDGGSSWRSLSRHRGGLLAWSDDALVLVNANGTVYRSTDDGRTFDSVGEIGGQPAALARHEQDLYVALHTNAVKVSSDGGRSWQERISPQAG
jgi:photosystem II stability/assembly factor-like uncharacterized protein